MERSTPLTVLLADDEAHIVYVLEAKLSEAGYAVVIARNGREALERAGECRPDLVITDLNMPIMNGLELSMALRSRPETSEVPVLMLTGRGHTVSDEDLAQTNIRHLEAKPFSARHILSLVRNLAPAA